MLKKWFSYLLPITIYKTSSEFNTCLEITWVNGELVLDSKNANYSFGSLQRILRKGLLHIGFENVKAMQEILILGVAGGSVIQTLKKEFKFVNKITGVEIDPVVLDLANQYFGLNTLNNVDLITYDAFEFVLRTKKKYDLIIIDIFFDTKMPEFLFEKHFIFRISQILQLKGFVIFNTMILTKEHNQRNLDFCELCAAHFKIEKLPRVEQHNELLILQKK
jgi:spermidine synthase